MKKKDSFFVPLIITLSIIVPILVALLMLFPDVFHIESESIDFSSLPFFHAVLNGSTAVLLFTGFILIKNKKTNLHKFSMLSAFILSSIFLLSYVTSKLTNLPVPFGGEGMIRYIYFFILISHIILSVLVLPLALFAIYRGMTGEIIKHKAIVRYTFPIWMYVAITGVMVYIFMSPYY
jgi:putative membrane protein|tara:strand:+ start:980 stop:1513 length:534 start_codon:yes stop_codon:yes gene_type:complete